MLQSRESDVSRVRVEEKEVMKILKYYLLEDEKNNMRKGKFSSF
jgi:hypothetical protein